LTDLSELRLFATRPHRCSYLPEQEATTVFVDPDAKMSGATFSRLSQLGFRRSGSHVYRPKCESCDACIPLRIPVELFVASRRQKRCLKINADLEISFKDSIDNDEYFQLYKKYIETRHADGDMHPPTRDQYLDFLTSEWGITRFVEFRHQQRLIMISVIDELNNGVSAIYAFFDPELRKRSLGVFNILYLIMWAQELALPYVYLGYWIKTCQKMSYKADYRPCQIFVNNQWGTIEDSKSSI